MKFFANLLSFSRMILAVVILIKIIEDNSSDWMLVGLCSVAILTDLLDGWFARKSRSGPTDFGKKIDNLADAALALLPLLAFVILGKIPWYWLAGVILVGLILSRKASKAYDTGWHSIAELLEVVAGIFYGFNLLTILFLIDIYKGIGAAIILLLIAFVMKGLGLFSREEMRS